MSDHVKKIIVYSSDTNGSAQALINQVCLTDERSDLLIHRSVNSFADSIARLTMEEPLLIVSIESKEEMNSFLGLTYLLDRFNLVVKLPPEDQPLAIMASRLRPRLVIYDWSDSERISLLIKGLLSKPSPMEVANKKIHR